MKLCTLEHLAQLKRHLDWSKFAALALAYTCKHLSHCLQKYQAILQRG